MKNMEIGNSSAIEANSLSTMGISERDQDRFPAIFDKYYNRFLQEWRHAPERSLTLMRVEQDSHEKTIPAVSDVVFRLVVDSGLKESTVDYGDGKTVLSGKRGSFYIAPANAEAKWSSDGNHRLLMLSVPEKKLREMLGIDDGPVSDDPLRSLYGKDIFSVALADLMERIWLESASNGAGSSLLVDGLFLTLAGTLARLASEPSDSPNKDGGAPLSKKRLALITEYIDSNLDAKIAIHEIAQLANMSPYHFSRCFRATTNTSPHRFVTARRIDRSVRLLADEERSLAEIAFECGFSSQSHFSSAFKDHMGTTPGAYRAKVSA